MLAAHAGTTRPLLSSKARPFCASRKCLPVTCASPKLAPLVKSFEDEQKKPSLPPVKIGDTVRIGLTVQEGKGKSRTQKLEGVVIAMRGKETGKHMVVRRIFQGVGIEICVPVHSPQLSAVEILRRAKVRRAKLFYLRNLKGKAARLKELVGVKK